MEDWNRPNGLWYACGPAWIRYMLKSHPELSKRYTHLYRIELGEDILRLPTIESVKRFSAQYGARGFSQIRWHDLQHRYAGVEVCPYYPNLGRYFGWYDAWDAATGCVWGDRGFVSAELLWSRA
jgi:hypothetical protein